MNDEPKDIFENLPEDLERAAKENENICKADDSTVYLWDGGAWYEIDLSRCETHEPIVDWIYHLTS